MLPVRPISFSAEPALHRLFISPDRSSKSGGKQVRKGYSMQNILIVVEETGKHKW